MSKHRKSSSFFVSRRSFINSISCRIVQALENYNFRVWWCVEVSLQLPKKFVMKLWHSANGFPIPSPPFHNFDHHLCLNLLWKDQMANKDYLLFRPMKKKGGVTPAGIARASGERKSPIGNGAFSNDQVSFHHICIFPSRWMIFFITFTPFVNDLRSSLAFGPSHYQSFRPLWATKCKFPDSKLCIPPLPSTTTRSCKTFPHRYETLPPYLKANADSWFPG